MKTFTELKMMPEGVESAAIANPTAGAVLSPEQTKLLGRCEALLTSELSDGQHEQINKLTLDLKNGRGPSTEAELKNSNNILDNLNAARAAASSRAVINPSPAPQPKQRTKKDVEDDLAEKQRELQEYEKVVEQLKKHLHNLNDKFENPWLELLRMIAHDIGTFIIEPRVQDKLNGLKNEVKSLEDELKGFDKKQTNADKAEDKVQAETKAEDAAGLSLSATGETSLEPAPASQPQTQVCYDVALYGLGFTQATYEQQIATGLISLPVFASDGGTDASEPQADHEQRTGLSCR